MKYSLLLLSLLFSFCSQANDKILIKLGEAEVKKSLLAFPPLQFFGNPKLNPNYQSVGSDLYKTIENDLDFSYYFSFISPKAYLEDTASTSLKPLPFDPKGFSFSKWSAINTEFLIRAGFSITGNKVELEAYLYHVSKSETLLSRKYTGDLDNLRLLAHTFSNDVLYRLTGKKGIFTTQYVVSSDRDSACATKTGKCTPIKEIYTMDFDGKNIKKITKHKSISISPAWSPDNETLVYTSYAYHPKLKVRNPDLFSYELNTGKSFLLSWRRGVNSGATFSPDGKNVYLTISNSGNSDIYRMDKDGEGLKNLTNGPFGALNVEPAVSPDGKKIAFSSDRHGKPMLYLMNIDGSGVKRLTNAGRYNSTPSWSPDGKKIVFAGHNSGHFDLFTVTADGTKIEKLTSAKKPNGKPANNEDPSFSPDGRHIVFISDRSGEKQIYVISPDGKNERRLTFDKHNYFKPKWSYLKD